LTGIATVAYNLPKWPRPQVARVAEITELHCCNRYFWQKKYARPYSANTLRAQKAAGAIFQVFCERRGELFLPAEPASIRAFIEHEVKAGKKPATVRRYIATIGRAHICAGLLNPCSGEAVRLALKKMGRETSARLD
jgi:hypothetical protein